MIRGDGMLRCGDYVNARTQAIYKQHQFRLALIDREGLDRTRDYLRNFGIATHEYLFQAAVGERAPMLAIALPTSAAAVASTSRILTATCSRC